MSAIVMSIADIRQSKRRKGVFVYGQHGVDLPFFLCFARQMLVYGDTALKPQFLLAFGAHKDWGVTVTLFLLFFPSIWVSWTPKHCKTRENARWQIDLVLPPHWGVFRSGDRAQNQFFCTISERFSSFNIVTRF